MRALFSSKSVWRLAPPVVLLVATGWLVPRLYAEKAKRTVEHVTLTNGFEIICDHRELIGDRVRFFTEAGGSDFVEVSADRVASVERVLVPEENPAALVSVKATLLAPKAAAVRAELTKTELHELLSGAGAQHNLDVNLLASLVHAESAGHARAVSKAGAQGLMQLMPRTAAQLGVRDSFEPEANVSGGVAYLDLLLTRYHDNLALALAAYNAGPAAVDRWHGVPPYRETQLYVARIIRNFNASIRASRLAEPAPRSDGETALAGSAGTIAR